MDTSLTATSAEKLLDLITKEQAWHYTIFPVSLNEDVLELLCITGKEDFLKGELEFILSRKVKLSGVESKHLFEKISEHYSKPDLPENAAIRKSDIPIINQSDNFLNRLIQEARSLRSSDIHIESYNEHCRIRIRIDGNLVERYRINRDEYPSLINKIKIQANLDISEKRLPQDGRILFKDKHVKFDLRVSVLPTLFGEKVVLRLLSNDASAIDIQQLGFSNQQLKVFLESARRPQGIILVSGPTGSGKTTTLYATLKLLNAPRTNILTVEDPIEYTLEGINQVQLKEGIGLTFANVLKTFLRQDPDVIMLGEIRDSETAQMAVRAALTGHLVLSTIHTNSAWGTVSRLVDMGVPSYLIANTINALIAQRLLRLLCPECKTAAPVSQSVYYLNDLFIPKREMHFVPVGCRSCNHTGYLGRKAIYEIITTDKELQTSIRNNDPEEDQILKSRGISSLMQNAISLYLEGLTSLEEIYPIVSSKR